MATKIGFQLNPNRFVFDPSKELDDFVDTIGQQEKDRETQRQKWRDEQDEFFKSANDLKATPNQQANEFFGKWSGGLMSEATELQSALENGRINSRDYTAQFRNLTQSNEQMIGAQKNYQTNAQRVADGVADGSLSSINSTDFNEYNKALELGAIEVERDGRGGFKVFNKNTGKVYNPYQLNNLTIGNIPRFDYNKAAATAVTQFGKRGIKDAAGNTVKGVYANMPGAELDILMEREAKVFVGSNQARTASILVDGLGYDVVYDKKDLKENTILKNQDGTFTFTEADEAAAVNEMKTALKNALPKDIEERQDLNESQKVIADQAQQRIDLQESKDKVTKDQSKERIDLDERKVEVAEERLLLDKLKVAEGITPKSDVLGDVGKYLDDNLNDLNETSEEDMQDKLIPILAPFGISVEQATPFQDEIKFTVGSGSNATEITIDLDDYTAESLKKFIQGFVASYASNESLIKGYKMIISKENTVNDSGKPTGGGVGGKYNPKE